MSDTEQPTPTEQPEEQPAPAEEQPTTESQPAEVEAEQPPANEEPPASGEETQPTEETPKEPETQPEETPAAEEGETQPSGEDVEPEPKPTEAELEAAAPAEGEGEQPTEGEQADPEPEVEEVQEEPVIITPEGSPLWLPTEEVLAKGLPESEVENFKNFYFMQTHSLQAWYDQLKDFAPQTEFITLSKEEIDALSVEGDPSEEQQQVLAGLEDRVNQAIELFEEDGAIVRVNGRSGKDAILERNEEAFIAEVRDAVVNELEVEKQRANAYAIWKEQERPPSAFKRGINSIRQSFRRSRVQSTGKKEEKPKLEEEEKKEEETKPAEGETEETPAPAEAAEGEATGGAEVTIEVEVEGGETTEDKESEQPAETPAEETPTEETPAEQPTEDQPPAEEAPKDEEEVQETPKDEGEVQEAPKDEEEAAKKEGDEEAPKEDGEIEKVEEKEEPKPKSPEHVHHKLRKAKTETLDNQILRAFVRSTAALFKVKSGKEAIDVLRRSVQIRSDLNQLKAFGGIEGVQVSLSVCRWQEQLPSYPGMELRGFVYKNELNALSQYNDTAYYPNVDIYHDTIQAKVQEFFKNNIQEPLKELENYIIDFYVTPEKVLVVRMDPFYTAIGACLFTWTENGKVLTQGPFEFRIVESPKTAPEAFSSFQPFWQTMLDSVLQQRRGEGRSGPKCVLL